MAFRVRSLLVLGGLFGAFTSGCGDDSDDSSQICTPHREEACYEGPEGTENVGACRIGVRTCLQYGDAFSECGGQVLPIEEDCATPADDDCDGEVNEGCACVPLAFDSCYTGPAGTENVGMCRPGSRQCNEDG